MNTQPNDSISPISAELMQKEYEGHYNNASARKPFGLTKREHFAAMAMQGILANEHDIRMTEEKTASLAVRMADKLINALNK